MKWIYLSLALIFESLGFVALKYSKGFSQTLPTLFTIGIDLLTILFFVLALKKMEASFVYMMATGIGTVLVVLSNYVVFNQSLNTIQWISVVMVILGSVGLYSQTEIL